jgi:hypothetical protein
MPVFIELHQRGEIKDSRITVQVEQIRAYGPSCGVPGAGAFLTMSATDGWYEVTESYDEVRAKIRHALATNPLVGS